MCVATTKGEEEELSRLQSLEASSRQEKRAEGENKKTGFFSLLQRLGKLLPPDRI